MTDRIQIDEVLLKKLNEYINENLEEFLIQGHYEEMPKYRRSLAYEEIVDLVNDLEKNFREKLFEIIDKKGLEDPQVYKKANIDRKLFSKIRTNKNYTPNKKTIIALALALELEKDEVDDLLKRAGYSLSNSNKYDVIIQFFIKEKIYDVYKINEYLYNYDLPIF